MGLLPFQTVHFVVVAVQNLQLDSDNEESEAFDHEWSKVARIGVNDGPRVTDLDCGGSDNPGCLEAKNVIQPLRVLEESAWDLDGQLQKHVQKQVWQQDPFEFEAQLLRELFVRGASHEVDEKEHHD